MKIRSLLQNAGLVESDTPDSALQGKSRTGNESVIARGPASTTTTGGSAADILLRRRNPPSFPPLASVPLPAAPQPRGKPVVDAEILDHFRNVADGSQMPGYVEFQKQVGVLRKHIPAEAALVVAALESSGVGRDDVVRAIEDRIALVEADKAGAVQALGVQKEDDVAARRARASEIETNITRLRREMAEREESIRALTAENVEIGRVLSESDETYENGVAAIGAAAENLLDELRSQKSRLQSAGQ